MSDLLCYSEDRATRPFELSINIHQNAWRHIPGNGHLKINREELEMENIKDIIVNSIYRYRIFVHFKIMEENLILKRGLNFGHWRKIDVGKLTRPKVTLMGTKLVIPSTQ